jgi:hypothetical protein
LVHKRVSKCLDNHHLIIRYRNNSNGNDKASHAFFSKETSKTIIGESKAPMRLGEPIYEDLSTFIIKFNEAEAQPLSSTKVISSALKQCHETQKNHFTNCLTPKIP